MQILLSVPHLGTPEPFQALLFMFLTEVLRCWSILGCCLASCCWLEVFACGFSRGCCSVSLGLGEGCIAPLRPRG